MKKFFIGLVCVLLICCSFFTFSACAPQEGTSGGDSDSEWLSKYY